MRERHIHHTSNAGTFRLTLAAMSAPARLGLVLVPVALIWLTVWALVH